MSVDPQIDADGVNAALSKIEQSIAGKALPTEPDERYQDVDYEGAADQETGRFVQFARHIRQYSPDPSTKIGALILDREGEPVVAGVNRFPEGIPASGRWVERPLKYDANTHGERGAIYNAARAGIPLEGASIVVTGTPCVACATAICSCGIKEVIIDRQADAGGFLDRFAEKMEDSLAMFKEAGVEVKVADVDENGRVSNVQTLDEYAKVIGDKADEIRAKRAAEAKSQAKPGA